MVKHNKMKLQSLPIILMLMFLLSLNLASAIVVDADYITIYSGEEGKVSVDIKNNEAFDIEYVSVQILLATVLPDGTPISLPFTIVGSSERNIDEINEDDDDTVSFTLKASTDILPGDYNILYMITYFNAEESNATVKQKTGSFGLRVSAKTDLDFAVEVNENAIANEAGKISLEIINKGLGEIKSLSVQIFPSGFELLSKDKIFIGSISADDTDIASFDVIYKSTSPTLSAKIEYKDFDNNAQTKTVSLPIKVYSKEKALELGLIKNPNYFPYIIGGGIIIIWYVIRKIKKRKKNKVRN